MNKSHKLNSRALVALVMICAFVWLPIAGIALHFADSAPFQPTRHLLMTIHDLAAIIFLISLTLHLKLNWKPMLNYLRASTEKYSRFRAEFGIAIVIVLLPLALGVLHVFALGR